MYCYTKYSWCFDHWCNADNHTHYVSKSWYWQVDRTLQYMFSVLCTGKNYWMPLRFWNQKVYILLCLVLVNRNSISYNLMWFQYKCVQVKSVLTILETSQTTCIVWIHFWSYFCNLCNVSSDIHANEFSFNKMILLIHLYKYYFKVSLNYLFNLL